MTSDFDAVVAGHICLDIYPDLSGAGREPFERMFQPGRLAVAGPVSYSVGGAVSNTGLALNRLGIASCLVGKIGDDLFGQAILQFVAGQGADLVGGLILDSAANTAYSIIINYPGADRMILAYPGANDTFSSRDVPYPVLSKARLFHFGYPPLMRSAFASGGAPLREIFQQAKSTGVTTSLDMAFPDPSSAAGQADWHSILGIVLPYVDIFLPSAEEIFYMLRRETYLKLCERAGGSDILQLMSPPMLSELARELIDMGAGIVGLKLGNRGMYLRTGDPGRLESNGRGSPSHPDQWAGKELWAPCFKVDVAGTTGSGDATIAGFLAAVLRGLPIEQALTMAVAVGACNVEAADALSGILTWEQTLQRITSRWPRQCLEIKEPGWEFDPASNLWRGPCA